MRTPASSPLSPATFLAPGQKYWATDLMTSPGTQEVTVVRLVRDSLGLLHATLRTDDGREISAFAEQVEAAIAEGMLRPVQATPIEVAC